MPEIKYRLATKIPSSLKFNEDNTADVELFREGEWKHPAAPNGWFQVNKDRIQKFITNFNRGVCGIEIPLEFNHASNSEKTPGWITKMYEIVKNGVSHLYGTMKLTDPITRERIKNGSLKYISPTVVSDYLDTASGQMFEVIRSATLTNYPHIKGLEPIIVNFEEIQNQEEMMKTEKEILENNDLQLEDIETITLEQLTNGDITLEYLTEPQIKELAEKFEMTVEQFQDKYPVAGEKMYGTRPKIKVPTNIPPEKKKAFMDAFNAAFERTKDMEKSMKFAMKSIGVMMEETPVSGVKEFVDQVLNYAKRKFGRPVDNTEEIEDGLNATKFQELVKQNKALVEWKEKIELQEDMTLVETFKTMTPAAKKLVQALLVAGRNTSLKFEEKTISLHDMLISLFEELKKSPTVNMFSEIAFKEGELALSEDLAANISKYKKDHLEVTERQAYDACFSEMKKAGQIK